MSLKVQYKQTTKKIAGASLKRCEQFMDKVRASFKDLPNPFCCYYVREDKIVDINDDASFTLAKAQNSIKIHVVEDKNSSRKISVNSVEQHKQKETKSNPKKQPVFLDEDQWVDMTPFTSIIKSFFLKEQKSQIPTPLPADPIPCSNCQSPQIVGRRYKSLQRFDIDICESCYKQCKDGEQFLLIQSDEMLKKLNFKDAIYYMFDPTYVEPDDNTIKPWIKEGDLTMDNIEAVSQIWRASQAIIQRMAQEL